MCTLLYENRLGIKKDMVNIFTCSVRKPARNSVTLSFKPPDSPPWYLVPGQNVISAMSLRYQDDVIAVTVFYEGVGIGTWQTVYTMHR